MENEQRGMITFILAVCGNVDYVYSFPLSPPSRAAWIEMEGKMYDFDDSTTSPPSRAAWIEISYPMKVNFVGVSRRLHGRRGLKSAHAPHAPARTRSPPSRAAWIEIVPSTLNS